MDCVLLRRRMWLIPFGRCRMGPSPSPLSADATHARRPWRLLYTQQLQLRRLEPCKAWGCCVIGMARRQGLISSARKIFALRRRRAGLIRREPVPMVSDPPEKPERKQSAKVQEAIDADRLYRARMLPSLLPDS